MYIVSHANSNFMSYFCVGRGTCLHHLISIHEFVKHKKKYVTVTVAFIPDVAAPEEGCVLRSFLPEPLCLKYVVGDFYSALWGVQRRVLQSFLMDGRRKEKVLEFGLATFDR